MTRAEVQRQAMQLPEEDRLQLAEELWASLENPDAVAAADGPIPQWQAELLDQRLEEAKDDPGLTWDEVKAEIRLPPDATSRMR